MPTRNVVRVPRHAIGVVKAALFTSAIPSSNDLAASGINLGITTAKAKDSSADTDLIIADVDGGGIEAAATPDREGVVRNVVVDSDAAPDTSSAAAVNHAIQRKNFDSVLDYLETKYVKSIVTDNAVDEGCNGSNNMNRSQSPVQKTTTMVTRTVVSITSAVTGNKPAAIKTTKNKQSEQSKKRISTSPVVTLDKEEMPLQKRRTKTLCSHPSCTKRAQHPSFLCWRHGAKDVACSFDGCNKKGILLGLCPDHGGLVQLCRWKGCINKVNLERRGGMCWMHQEYSADSDSECEESEGDGEIRLCSFKGCISVATGGGMCVRHSTTYDDDFLDQSGEKKKRSLSLRDIADNETTMKRQTQQNDSFVVDLSGVPPQPPIPKSSGRIKEGASKYTGVSFNKKSNKWVAQIFIDGKQRLIGYYDEEEEAAVDYARAVFKYRGAEGQDHRESFAIDLSGVPPQPPIRKSSGRIKEGASKYTGVSFHKKSNKWITQISLDGKQRLIGYYDDEYEAAVDYARALFQYKGGSEGQSRESESFVIDLSDTPPQPPIPKSSGRIKEGASKYTGVSFDTKSNKWVTQIMVEGKQHRIGYYSDEEEAAIDYARAVFKYRGADQT